MADVKSGEQSTVKEVVGGPQRAQKRKADVALAYAPDDDVLEEYKCPITQELPVEPVVAEDGHCYDQPAIEEWFSKSSKSPMTNQAMGRKLVPAVQVRSAIERLISKGVISGEAAKTWTEKQAELQSVSKLVRETLVKARQGNVEAMRSMGFFYRDGEEGCEVDNGKAMMWWKRAAEKNDASSIVSIGAFHVNGVGVPKDPARGMIDLARAAMLGSEHGACCLGNHFASGEALVAPDPAEATYWYKFSKTTKLLDTHEKNRTRRDEWLRQHGGA
jgi:TPR repeat protein